MDFKKFAMSAGTAAMVTVGIAAGSMAMAKDGIYIPLLTYRTGPFAGSGTPIANGMRGYFNVINERDNGVSGVKLIVEEC